MSRMPRGCPATSSQSAAEEYVGSRDEERRIPRLHLQTSEKSVPVDRHIEAAGAAPFDQLTRASFEGYAADGVVM